MITKMKKLTAWQPEEVGGSEYHFFENIDFELPEHIFVILLL